MSYDSWTILMVKKGPGVISDEVCRTLKAAACRLSLKKWEQMHIGNDACCGLIKTSWVTARVGGRSGILFRAEVESMDEPGAFQVNFLLNEEDLKRGEQILREMEEAPQKSDVMFSVGEIPCALLYDFADLTASRTLN